jgi:hypothetical protein
MQADLARELRRRRPKYRRINVRKVFASLAAQYGHAAIFLRVDVDTQAPIAKKYQTSSSSPALPLRSTQAPLQPCPPSLPFETGRRSTDCEARTFEVGSAELALAYSSVECRPTGDGPETLPAPETGVGTGCRSR